MGVERATRKNSQLAAARRVAFKMGRLLRCSSVTYRSRYASLAPVRLGPPRRRPILNATKLKGFRRRYTRKGNIFAGGYEGGKNANTNLWCYFRLEMLTEMGRPKAKEKALVWTGYLPKSTSPHCILQFRSREPNNDRAAL